MYRPGMSRTFLDVGLETLDLRETDAYRAVTDDRLRFRKHLAPSALSRKKIEEIKPSDISDLRRSLIEKTADDNRGHRRLSAGSVKKILNLTSFVFAVAVEKGLREDNPCHFIRKTSGVGATSEPWTFLTKDEVESIINLHYERNDVWTTTFAIYTGLRQGEQWNLEKKDVRLDSNNPHVVVRYGAFGMAPKNGKIRKVPLFGMGLLAATHVYDRANHLMFSTESGRRRQPGAPTWFPDLLKEAGITRHVRWHDLRHTCGSALLNGYWGEPWDLVTIRDMLGHSSVKVTEKYAHSSKTRLQEAASRMR